MPSLVIMVAMSAALAVLSGWAATRELPDAGLPQPQLANTPEEILAMRCSSLKVLRLEIAARELGVTIQHLRDRRQTAQVQRVLAERRRQRTGILAALRETGQCRSY